MDHNIKNNEMWDWQRTEIYLEDNLDMSKCLWSSMNQNEDIPYSFDDVFTPVKACGELPDYVNIFEDTSKELEKCGEHSSQVKRRRVLQFDSEVLASPPHNEEMSSVDPRSKGREDSAEEGSSNMAPKLSGYSDPTFLSCHESLNQSSDAWIASCFSDADMQYSPSNMASDVQIDITEFCKAQCPPKYVNQELPVHTRGNLFKGRKSYIRTPAKLTSSVVYPFAFIKPCGIHGDMTLKDINQWIRTPQPKLKQNTDDLSAYPTSAFSGKPVVGRTTLSTDGGKGSITIMRTKG